MHCYAGTKQQFRLHTGRAGTWPQASRRSLILPQGKVLHHKMDKIEKKVPSSHALAFGFKTPFFVCGKYSDLICKSEDPGQSTRLDFLVIISTSSGCERLRKSLSGTPRVNLAANFASPSLIYFSPTNKYLLGTNHLPPPCDTRFWDKPPSGQISCG